MPMINNWRIRMPKDEKEKLVAYTIGADLYDDQNNLKKIEVKVEAKNEEEAFDKFAVEVKKIHNGKFYYNGLLKIIKQ